MGYANRSRLSDQGRRNGGSRASIADFRFEKKTQKPMPPPETHAESFYYLKQMNSKTPMVLILGDGEQVRGWIEWYDRECLKIHRNDGPNLLVPKHSIKYLFKEEELTGAPPGDEARGNRR